MSDTVYITNDMALTYDAVDTIGAADLSGATVSVTVTDADGAEVTGETWPLSLSYVGTTTTDMDGDAYSGTRYRYRATLADVINWTSQGRYTAQVSFDGGAGLQGTHNLAVVAKTRTGSN